jgi:hypothetical protein
VTSTNKIVIGDVNTGNVTFTEAIDLAKADTLEIITGGTVNDTGDSTVFTDANLAINAAQGVGTTSTLNMAVNNFEADGGTGGVNVSDTGDITIGGVSGTLNGVSATGGDITITASSPLTVNEAVVNSGGGNVSLTANNGVTLSGANADVTTNGGTLTIDADSDDNGSGTYTQDNASSAVVTANGNVTITAADVDLTGTINAGAASVSFVHSQAGETITLGTAAGGGGGGFAAELELSSLLTANGGDGSTGFVLNGIGASDLSGFSVSSAGDVNGDGVDDLIIGAFQADPNGSDSGES